MQLFFMLQNCSVETKSQNRLGTYDHVTCVGKFMWRFTILKCILSIVFMSKIDESSSGVNMPSTLFSSGSLRLQPLEEMAAWDSGEASAAGTPGTPTGSLPNLKCLNVLLLLNPPNCSFT